MFDATPPLPRCDEWIGALVSLPSYVTGEGDPFRPTAVMWLEPSTGIVVDSQLVRPEEALPRAAGLFLVATREPIAGEPRMPSRVRVADESLAHALRDSLRDVDVDIVVAPTPEVDEVVAALLDHLARRGAEGRDEDAEAATSFIGPDCTPADLAAMFREAARLYRAQPWQVIPSDAFVGVTCEQLGIEVGALCVVGQLGESFGFSLFQTVDDAVRFLAAAEAHGRGERGAFPRHYMFMFDDRREMAAPLISEVAREGWEIAGPRAYPSFVVIDPDLVSRGVTREELAGLTGVVAALAELVEAEPRVFEAWETDEPVEHTSDHETPVGDIRVTLRAPLWLPGDEPGLGSGLDAAELATLESVVDPDGVLDEDLFEQYRDALFERFAAAPEANEDTLGLAEVLVEYAATQFGATIVGLQPEELTTLLFRVIPKMLTVEADEAQTIVDTMRALLTFADRALGSRTAKQCLAKLGPDAVKRLARELADDRNFGAAKSLFMDGKRSGYDLTSEAGVAAFVDAVNRGEVKTTVSERAKRKPKTAAKAKATATAKTKAKATATGKSKAKATAKTKPKATAKTKAKPTPAGKSHAKGHRKAKRT